MTDPKNQNLLSRIGPGLITACVVIGPGSILTSSTVGATHGYKMIWVVLLSVLLMQAFMTMGAKLGSVSSASPCDLIRRRAGKWLAVSVGVCILFICAAFQAGNNIAVAAVFSGVVESKVGVSVLVVAFNALAIAFLFMFGDLYRWFERLMTIFVGLMLLSFVINLVVLRPSATQFARGFIPTLAGVDLALLGLVGTTFAAAAAFYQAYLVRQKGWGRSEVRNAILDARVGASVMAVITITLMATAACGLHRPGQAIELRDPMAIAEALRPTFGELGKWVFCLGLFCAAYSSFLVNAMIGGIMASDGFGLGDRPSQHWPRVLTTGNLLVGMLVAVAITIYELDTTPAIILAQVLSVVLAPVIAGVLFWLSSDNELMGDDRNGKGMKTLGVAGLALLIAMSLNTALVKLPKKFNDYLAPAVVEKTQDG